mmetsp:Transcript_22313/g.63864  ORF Transcript_22313/g.63864 Transcript_22313/m.63864 type:complete len:246 (-) Transcript_22313:828-1565(-)
MFESLPYSRSRAVTNWIMSKSIAPWIDAMSMIGASSFALRAAEVTEAWWNLWNSKNHATKLSSFIRSKRPPGRSGSWSLDRGLPKLLLSKGTKLLNELCMNSSKNFRRPARTSSPMALAASKEFFTCGFSKLWSRTEPSSRSVKKGSWNMFSFLEFLASGLWNSRRQMWVLLVTLCCSITDVNKVSLPSAVRDRIAVPKRLCRVAIGFRILESAWSRARRSVSKLLSFSRAPRVSASGSVWAQML